MVCWHLMVSWVQIGGCLDFSFKGFCGCRWDDVLRPTKGIWHVQFRERHVCSWEGVICLVERIWCVQFKGCAVEMMSYAPLKWCDSTSWEDVMCAVERMSCVQLRWCYVCSWGDVMCEVEMMLCVQLRGCHVWSWDDVMCAVESIPTAKLAHILLMASR